MTPLILRMLAEDLGLAVSDILKVVPEQEQTWTVLLADKALLVMLDNGRFVVSKVTAKTKDVWHMMA